MVLKVSNYWVFSAVCIFLLCSTGTHEKTHSITWRFSWCQTSSRTSWICGLKSSWRGEQRVLNSIAQMLTTKVLAGQFLRASSWESLAPVVSSMVWNLLGWLTRLYVSTKEGTVQALALLECNRREHLENLLSSGDAAAIQDVSQQLPAYVEREE